MNALQRRWAPGLLALALGVLFAAQALAADYPRLTGRVVDEANVLSEQTERDLTAKLATLENDTRRQLVVVTLKNLRGQEIEEYGYQLGREWGIGQRGENDGAIFIIAPSERKVRIEVGYGLEGVITDALSSVILQRKVLPAFRSGNVERGIVDGTDALIEQLALPETEAREQAAQARPATSRRGGGPSWVGILILFLAIWVISGIFRGGGGRRRRGRRSLDNSAIPWIVLGALANSGRGGRPSWGGGGGGSWGGGGGWSGGGGFSGGGGSFGGGGASGSW